MSYESAVFPMLPGKRTMGLNFSAQTLSHHLVGLGHSKATYTKHEAQKYSYVPTQHFNEELLVIAQHSHCMYLNYYNHVTPVKFCKTVLKSYFLVSKTLKSWDDGRDEVQFSSTLRFFFLLTLKLN